MASSGLSSIRSDSCYACQSAKQTLECGKTYIGETGPLGESVGNVNDALAVEHVQAGLELSLVLVALEVDERGEEQDHVAALVHDG